MLNVFSFLSGSDEILVFIIILFKHKPHHFINKITLNIDNFLYF
jgi:hypothetical protein